MKVSKESKAATRRQWFILITLFATVVVAFIGRLSTSVALVEIGKELAWSEAEKGFLGGLLMGIFLVSYGFSNVFFSPRIDTHGPGIVLLLSVAGCSASIFIGALLGHIYHIFILSRLLLGISQGVLFPVGAKVIADWFVPRQRARANSFFIIGSSVGVAMAPLAMAPIMQTYGWRNSFYMVAALGILLILPISFFIKEKAKKNGHHRISSTTKAKTSEAFRRFMGDKDFRQITVGFSTVNTIWWGATLWVPTYLGESHNLNLGDMPYMAAIPYLGAIAGLLTGSWISDKRGGTNHIIMFSLFTTGVMFVVLALIPTSGMVVALSLLTLMFFFGQMTPPLFFTKLQNTIDGRELGSATGLMNGIANTVGVAGPLGVGVMIALTGSYSMGLLFLTLVAFTGLMVFRKLL